LVNPGNSGGPLADTQGRVVGAVTWGLRDATGINYAVASDEIAAFLNGSGGQTPAPPPSVGTGTPALVGGSFGPRSAAPGGTVTLTYEVQTDGGGSAPVTLGASIRPAGGRWIDDAANDLRVEARPGRGTYSRIFKVPESAPPGDYEVWLNVLSQDMQKSYGQRVETGLAVRAGSPESAPAAKPSAAGPVDVVRSFYGAIGSKTFQAAWGMLSPRFQASIGYDKWVGGYANTRSVETPNAALVAQAGETATVSVTIVATDAEGGRMVTRRFAGTWDLVRANGSWKLDRASIRPAD
jgi:hypothetical protein